MLRAVGLCLVLALLGATAMASEHFKDVPNDHWAAPSVEKLAEMGVMKGYPDGAFRGDKPVTRYELAEAMVRLIEQMRESAKPLVGEKKQEPKSESKKPTDPIAFLKSGGFLTEDSPLLQKDTAKTVTVDQLAQTLATVAAKLVEERVPAPAK